MESSVSTEYENILQILQKGNIKRMGDWNDVGKFKPSNVNFGLIKPDNWEINFPFRGYNNQLLSNGNLNISSTSSAVIKMKLTDIDNPGFDKLFTNQQHEGYADVTENTTHGLDLPSGRSLSGIASGGFSSCAFQATWATKGDDHYLLVSHIQSFSPLKSLLNQYELTLEHVTKVLTIVNPNVTSLRDQAVDSTFTTEEKQLLDTKSVYWVKYQTIFPGTIFGGFAFDRVVISFLPQNLKYRIWLACGEGPLGAVVTSVLAYPDDMQIYTRQLCQKDSLADVDPSQLQKHILSGDFGDQSRIVECLLKAPNRLGLQTGSMSAKLMAQLARALVAGDGATWQRALGGNRTQICYYLSENNPQF